jgi:hypothetical protein
VIFPEKTKRKGPPQSRAPWVYVLFGIAVGVIGASLSMYVINEMYRATFASPVPLITCGLGIVLIVLPLGIAMITPSSSQRTLRQKPDNPLVIQEMIAGEWHDVLIVNVPPEVNTPAKEPEKEKTLPPAHRSSLLWAALAALLTSLYSVLLARPSRDTDRGMR